MKVEFLKRFSKDLDDIKAKSVKQSVIRLTELIEAVDRPEGSSKRMQTTDSTQR
jgi:hypothetical protein